MRIAIDVAQTCGERAGCAWHAHNLASELSQQIDPQDLILYHDFGEWINADKSKGTHLIGIAEPFATIPYASSKHLWENIEKNEEHLPGNPDIVISNSIMCPKIPKAKQIYTIYDLCFWSHSQFTTNLNRNICQTQLLRSLKYADGFVFISKQSQDDFERYFPSWLENNNKPIIQIPPIRARYTTIPCKSTARFSDPQAYWLHVGTIEPRKGIDDLLDAYEAYYLISEIKRPLKLIGGLGWMTVQIHERIKELSTRLPIFYEGYLSDQERQNRLDQAFALICSSKYEGYGLPIDEAADSGLPAISTPVPSHKKYSRELRHHIDLSFSRATLAMIELESNMVLYKQVSSITQNTAKDSDPEKCTRSLVQFYKSLLQR